MTVKSELLVLSLPFLRCIWLSTLLYHLTVDIENVFPVHTHFEYFIHTCESTYEYLWANLASIHCFLVDGLKWTSWIKKLIHFRKNMPELIWVTRLETKCPSHRSSNPMALGHLLCPLTVHVFGLFSGLLRSFTSLAVQIIFIKHLLCVKHYATHWSKQSPLGSQAS